jgi:uncharacterized membrane protein
MKSFAAAAITILILDFCWIGLLMSKFYQTQLGALLRFKSSGGLDPIWWAAFAVYIFLPLGIVVFVLPKAAGASATVAAQWGFVFGLVVYGVYDFTSYSLLKTWPLTVTLVDLVWGSVLCAIASFVAAWVGR